MAIFCLANTEAYSARNKACVQPPTTNNHDDDNDENDENEDSNKINHTLPTHQQLKLAILAKAKQHAFCLYKLELYI